MKHLPTLERLATGPLLIFATALLAIELAFGLWGEYGLFIDELYYLACASRLDWGYVDHPPLAPAILRLSSALISDPAWALRLPAALAGSATVLVTGFMAQRLGAGTFGQCLAALGVLSAPIPMLFFGFFSMNAFEVLLWTVCATLLVLIEQWQEPRLWLAFGAAAGVGLMNKHTIVLFAAGLAVGLVATQARRHLRQKYLWFGLGVAAIIFLPNLLWQISHDWPTLDFYVGAGNKNIPTPPLEVLLMQVLTMGPINVLLWLAGLLALLGSAHYRPYRHLGFLALTLLTLAMMAQQSRPDRLAGLYPFLFAAGAAVLDRFTVQRRALRWALPVVLLAGGAMLLPIGVPVLKPAVMAEFVARIGVVPQIEQGAGKASELPQWWADRFGWQQLSTEVATVAARLTPAERRRAAIFAPSYGQAGALELYGSAGLEVYSTHNNYFLWGPPQQPLSVAIVIGDSREHLSELFAEVELAMVHDCQWCIRWRDEMPIWIVRQPLRPMKEVWPELRSFG